MPTNFVQTTWEQRFRHPEWFDQLLTYYQMQLSQTHDGSAVLQKLMDVKTAQLVLKIEQLLPELIQLVTRYQHDRSYLWQGMSANSYHRYQQGFDQWLNDCRIRWWNPLLVGAWPNFDWQRIKASLFMLDFNQLGINLLTMHLCPVDLLSKSRHDLAFQYNHKLHGPVMSMELEKDCWSFVLKTKRWQMLLMRRVLKAYRRHVITMGDDDLIVMIVTLFDHDHAFQRCLTPEQCQQLQLAGANRHLDYTSWFQPIGSLHHTPGEAWR